MKTILTLIIVALFQGMAHGESVHEKIKPQFPGRYKLDFDSCSSILREYCTQNVDPKACLATDKLTGESHLSTGGNKCKAAQSARYGLCRKQNQAKKVKKTAPNDFKDFELVAETKDEEEISIPDSFLMSKPSEYMVHCWDAERVENDSIMPKPSKWPGKPVEPESRLKELSTKE